MTGPAERDQPRSAGVALSERSGTSRRAAEAVPWHADSSLWPLLVTNVFTLSLAVYDGWSATSLMMLYWAQSAVIGLSSLGRILALDRFSTENFTINRRPVAPTVGTKLKVAGFFSVHYGAFHVAYLLYLLRDAEAVAAMDSAFWVCVATFAGNHAWSYVYNRDRDRSGAPNIGTLMLTPYLRIIPMHVTIVVGGRFIDSPAALLMFGLLKVAADVAMHVVEHAQLQKTRAV